MKRSNRPCPRRATRSTLVGCALLVGSALALRCAPEGVVSNNNVDTNNSSCDPLVLRANLPCEDDPDVERALSLLRQMSLEEKVQQMSGPPYNPNNFFDQEDNERLDIPGLLYMDGPRGVRWYNSDYGTTVYPVAVARASSWDVELERLVGKAMAKEMRYLGRHVLLAPTINQVMHPRWGRAQETYGEDSFLLGEMGAALVRGAQYDPTLPDPADPDHEIEDTYRIQACTKHFAANNIEDTRIYVNAVLDERTMREVYLPMFRRAVEADTSCVMAAYNRVNGDYSGYSAELLRDVLKEDWGFSGYVISDWFAKGQTINSPPAGLDVEMPFSSGPFPSQFDSSYFYGSQLAAAVNADQVEERYVDEAVLRILYRKVHFGLLDHEVGWEPWRTKSTETQALALRAAREGTVLLKNGPSRALADDVLPLEKTSLSKVAVIGKFANSENMGDKGSSDAKVVDSTLVVTPFEGIREALPDATLVTHQQIAGHEADISDADLVVVVAAYFYADLQRSSSGEEGEWKDRESMDLPQRDLDNIASAVALKSTRPDMKVVVVAKSGGAFVVDDWIAGVDALLVPWYGGMKEGTALADILFGNVNPSGKVVQSFPRRESDLPAFRNQTQGDVEYDYFHGYRWLDARGVTPRYPFGFGLGYTTFEYSNLTIADASVPADGTVTVSVDVENTGPVTGTEVVQLYVGYDDTSLSDAWGRPKKDLRAFARAEDLAPGEKQTVRLEVDVSSLGYWDSARDTFVVEKMSYRLYVGPSSDLSDSNVLTGAFTVR